MNIRYARRFIQYHSYYLSRDGIIWDFLFEHPLSTNYKAEFSLAAFDWILFIVEVAVLIVLILFPPPSYFLPYTISFSEKFTSSTYELIWTGCPCSSTVLLISFYVVKKILRSEKKVESTPHRKRENLQSNMYVRNWRCRRKISKI